MRTTVGRAIPMCARFASMIIFGVKCVENTIVWPGFRNMTVYVVYKGDKQEKKTVGRWMINRRVSSSQAGVDEKKPLAYVLSMICYRDVEATFAVRLKHMIL